jgi:NAD(P)H-dependent flavin oxidoreductase YrpB (nitropropane dioxygenase family)
MAGDTHTAAHEALPGLGIAVPLLAAPMAGGPTTPDLVVAAARAGGLGFLAGGYKSAPQLAAQILAVRAADAPFGVNLFAPNPVPVDAGEFRRYAGRLRSDAEAYGLDLGSAEPVDDDDDWQTKIDLLLSDPVPVVSFTFGLPDRLAIAALRRAGSVVMQTVTSAAEARAAAEAGIDVLVVQAAAAGGHSATLTPSQPPQQVPLPALVEQVRGAVALPLIAAGGLATADDIAAAIHAGAQAAMVGTVLLRTRQSGASAVHKSALADASARPTVVTRAFTGRPARGLRNRFTEAHSSEAPLGYPAVHHLTGPLRRAAAAAGDPERVNLWAGTGYRHGREEDAQQTITRLAARL